MANRQNDLKTLRHLLWQLLRAYGGARRPLEDRLGVGHGNLERLFDGSLHLRVGHVLALAELLGVRPGALLDLGCPETTAAARREVADWLSPGRPAVASGLAEQKARERRELVELIDESVRRALERSGLRLDPPRGFRRRQPPLPRGLAGHFRGIVSNTSKSRTSIPTPRPVASRTNRMMRRMPVPARVTRPASESRA